MKIATICKWLWRKRSFVHWTKKILWNSVHNEQSYRRACWPTLSRQCAFGVCQCIWVRAMWLWCQGNFPPNFPQSDLGRRADSCWALPKFLVLILKNFQILIIDKKRINARTIAKYLCLVHRAFPCPANSDASALGVSQRSASVLARPASESSTGRCTPGPVLAVSEDRLHDTFHFRDLSVLMQQTFRACNTLYPIKYDMQNISNTTVVVPYFYSEAYLQWHSTQVQQCTWVRHKSYFQKTQTRIWPHWTWT